MFSFMRKKRVVRKVWRRIKFRPFLEGLEERTVLSRINYAFNPSGTGFPSPLESDHGWGGGSYPWEIVDNREDYPEWDHGLAFTGGPPPYIEPAGPRQVTINFGTNRTFQQIVVWHHGAEHIPATNDPQGVRLEYWNGSSWQSISFTRSLDLNDRTCGAGSTPDYYTFSPVTGSKVRWWLDNRRNNVLGNQIEHGWIYEFQVWNEPAPRNLATAQMTCFNRANNQDATGIAVVNTGTDYAVHLAANTAEQGTDGWVVSNRVPYALNAINPTWNRTWPNAPNRDDFYGIAATTDAVYAAGSSWSRTVDTVGDKENKGITVRFNPANGAETWATQTPAAPGAFPYGGGEILNDLTTAVEGSQTFLYATGNSQSGFYNNGRLYVSKLTTAGSVLWTRTDAAGDPFSSGAKVAAAGSNVYVAGFTEDSGARRAYLKKYDANGNLTWARTSELGAFQGLFVDSVGGALYAVGRTASGPASDFLIEKWDLAGNRLWSRSYDRSNMEDALNGVVLVNGRLFAVGSTRGDTSGGLDGVILEVNPATGALVNTTLWGGTNDDSFAAVTATPTALHIAATTASLGANGRDVVYLIFALGQGNTCTVTNGNDSGPGSLRDCLTWANSNPGRDTITFNIPGTGVHTINLTSPLPAITDPVVIDGSTQPGYAGPIVELNGASAGANANGLTLNAGNSTVKSLVLNRFTTGAAIYVNSNGNLIQDCHIGTNVPGTTALGNLDGIVITGSSNRVGGLPAGGNVISGNARYGVAIMGSSATGNILQRNAIGTTLIGSSALGNGAAGVFLSQASGNMVGTTTTGDGNTISGNHGPGVQIQGATARNNLIQSNRIGTDYTATIALGNTGSGVMILDAPNNTIGGTVAGARNIISGNQQHGIMISGMTATGNVLQGNYIGTNAAGTAALPNQSNGVAIQDAPNNTVGGTVAGAGNVISGNQVSGVLIINPTATNNTVQGNWIGTNATGTGPLGNYDGVYIALGATGNLVGGTTVGAGNVISGNRREGIHIEVPNGSPTGNVVQGNYIGVAAPGSVRLGNASHGVTLLGGHNTVGGTATGARNVISGNGEDGVHIAGTQATGNVIQGNFVGTNAAGTDALPNNNGVSICLAPSNTIGGTAPGSRNVISGNTQDGVIITCDGTTGNLVQGNLIGTDFSGTSALANGNNGVSLYQGPTSNLIGGTSAESRNVISGNGRYGVLVIGGNTSGNLVQGNYIGTDVKGMQPLGNASHGVLVQDGANNNTIGGSDPAARNLISANGGAGVWLEGGDVTANVIQGNSLGTDATDRDRLLGNVLGGVYVNGASWNLVAGNHIAFNIHNGVTVLNGTGNTITQNSIHDNADLGIDIGDDGVTDASAPVLDSAWSIPGAGTYAQGYLLAAPMTSYTLEFFVNSDSDPSGYGEGEIYLGTDSVATDPDGFGYFQSSFALVVPPGYCLSVTATAVDGTTGEFSLCVPVDSGSAPTAGRGGKFAALLTAASGAEASTVAASRSEVTGLTLVQQRPLVPLEGGVPAGMMRGDASHRLFAAPEPEQDAAQALGLLDTNALDWLVLNLLDAV